MEVLPDGTAPPASSGLPEPSAPHTPPELVTIGAFARMSQLSPKALRLYDELGLLRPAAAAPATATTGRRRSSGPG